jgi:hypothetical protein
MSIPTSRDEFTEYCLKKLGRPVIEIDVSDDQVQDRIDEAILFWQDFDQDGTERQLFKYQITPTDFANRYIVLPSNIIGVVRLFDQGDIEGSNYMFNVRYQIALNDLYTLTSVSMVPYYMAFQHLQLLEQLLVGQKQIRYNRITNRLYLDIDWSLMCPGQFIIVDCYQVIDPDVYTAYWGDRMLAKYATALIKKQWGTNVGKYTVPMIGNVSFNGQQIYEQAEKELADLEEKMITQYSAQPMMQVG